MEEKKVRKYYRLLVKRTPPYSTVNASYFLEHDLYAYSKDGAFSSFSRYHKNGYGRHTIITAREISKDEFRGQHKTADPELMSMEKAIERAKETGVWNPGQHREAVIKYKTTDGRTNGTMLPLNADAMEEGLKALWQERHRGLNADPDSIILLHVW